MAKKTEETYKATPTEIKNAESHDKVIRQDLAQMSDLVVDVCESLYAMQVKPADKAKKPLYRALGIKTWPEYCSTRGIEASWGKVMSRIGRMMTLCHKDIGKIPSGTVSKIGVASLVELARLVYEDKEAKLTYETTAKQNGKMIGQLIKERESGKIPTVKELKARIDEFLGVKKDPKSEPAASGNGGNEAEPSEESNYPEWKRAILKLIATAKTPADVAAELPNIVSLYQGEAEDNQAAMTMTA